MSATLPPEIEQARALLRDFEAPLMGRALGAVLQAARELSEIDALAQLGRTNSETVADARRILTAYSRRLGASAEDLDALALSTSAQWAAAKKVAIDAYLSSLENSAVHVTERSALQQWVFDEVIARLQLQQVLTQDINDRLHQIRVRQEWIAANVATRNAKFAEIDAILAAEIEEQDKISQLVVYNITIGWPEPLQGE